MRYLFIPILLCVLSINSFAQLRLPAIISSRMVLQQNDSAMLWGWANPSEKIFVTTSWNNHTDSTITSNGAIFKIRVKTPPAGGPYTINFRGSRNITLTDIMIGEVWVCSGQSNMEWSYMHGLKDVRDELPTAYNPRIRFFHIPKSTSEYPQDDVRAEWTICDSNTLKTFSAVAYFFGKKISSELNVPVGLIHASWGGTPAEVWTPKEVVNNNEDLRLSAARLQTFRWWPNVPGQAYNAMIYPVTNYNIAGAIWYQGESNTVTNNTYQRLFTSMIDGWRKAWNRQFPFYYVQIAPYNYANNNIGALLQEAQLKASSHPKTGMVVVTDLVDTVADIHPTNKHDVGYRLANWALGDHYGVKGVVYKYPVLRSSSVSKGRMTLNFDNVGKGFMQQNNPVGFIISGDTEEWHPASAKIERDKIIVWSDRVKNPVHVRYAFGNTIIGNISTRDGLPLPPFRTDAWPVDQKQIR